MENAYGGDAECHGVSEQHHDTADDCEQMLGRQYHKATQRCLRRVECTGVFLSSP